MANGQTDIRKALEVLPPDVQERVIREGMSGLASGTRDPRFSKDNKTVVKELKAKHESLTKKHKLRLGQFVKWKDGLKNRKRPLQDEPAIVVDVLDSPVFDTEEKTSASPYYREPLDLVLGLLDKDGDLLTYYFDSRRFEPFDMRAPKKRKSRKN